MHIMQNSSSFDEEHGSCCGCFPFFREWGRLELCSFLLFVLRLVAALLFSLSCNSLLVMEAVKMTLFIGFRPLFNLLFGVAKHKGHTSLKLLSGKAFDVLAISEVDVSWHLFPLLKITLKGYPPLDLKPAFMLEGVAPLSKHYLTNLATLWTSIFSHIILLP